MLIASKRVSVAVPALAGGVYMAICVGLVDLGEQFSRLYQKTQYRVLLTFEVVGELVEVDGEGKPRWLSKEYTMSLDKKASLRKVVEACNGRELTAAEEDAYDLRELIGKGCQITVKKTEKDGRVYNDIGEAVALARGTTAAAPVSDVFTFDMDAPDARDVFLTLPEWMRRKVESSVTWQSKTANSEDFAMPDAKDACPLQSRPDDNEPDF